MGERGWNADKIRRIVEHSFALGSPALIEYVKLHFIVEPNIHFGRLGLLRVAVITFRRALKSQYTIRLVKGQYDGARIYLSLNLMPAEYVRLLPLAMSRSTLRIFVGFLQAPIFKARLIKGELRLGKKASLSQLFKPPLYHRTPKGKTGLKYLELAYVKVVSPLADYREASSLFKNLTDREPLFGKKDFRYFEKYYWLGNAVAPLNSSEKRSYVYVEGPDAVRIAFMLSDNPHVYYSWIGENEVFIVGDRSVLDVRRIKKYTGEFRISLPIKPIVESETKAFLTPFFEYYDGERWETPHIVVD